ncbi:MAG: M20 family metallopeptidase [Haliangiales bacterium]
MSKTQLSPNHELAGRAAELIALRRDFHRHPEVGFEERRTAEIIAARLAHVGLEVTTGIAQTGVVGVLHGDRPGRTIAWRADIDALPIHEAADVPFASEKRGVMHACGHDGHTAIALTVAELLAKRRAELPGTVVFVFQPAEEIFAGARPMLAAGVLDDPRCDEVYGLHLSADLPLGRVAARPGPAMASADFFELIVRGQGGHGASPHQTIDPITAAAHILIGLQDLVAKELSARETAVLSVGQLSAGTAANTIPDHAVMRGTLRTLSSTAREQLLERLRVFSNQLALAYRAEANLHVNERCCPPLVNHDQQAAFVHRCADAELGEGAFIDGEPVMASDDMSLFLEARPGCYFRVGAAPADKPASPHHSPSFEIDEASLTIGARLATAVLLQALAPLAPA